LHDLGQEPYPPSLEQRSYRSSRPLGIAAMTRGLRRPCMMAITHSGFPSGAYAIS
jgi:hypothetical protein